MKKALSFLLCLCMMLAIVPGTGILEAKAEDGNDLALDASNQALCPACNETVTWMALSGSKPLGNYADGQHRHFYLSGDLNGQAVDFLHLSESSDMCLHLQIAPV